MRELCRTILPTRVNLLGVAVEVPSVRIGRPTSVGPPPLRHDRLSISTQCGRNMKARQSSIDGFVCLRRAEWNRASFSGPKRIHRE
jgi:hypothetical protein